jgi:rare lipoprotein A (peptidoglycan hydrolase)
MFKTICCGLLGLGTTLGVVGDSVKNTNVYETKAIAIIDQQVDTTVIKTASLDATAQTSKASMPEEPKSVATIVPLNAHPIVNRKSKTTRIVYVSWYKQRGITASGERYNPHAFTVAHKTLPFGTMVRFMNINTGITVIARVNDRGPYIKGREFDLSESSAKLLGLIDKGVAKVEVEIIQKNNEVHYARRN